LIPLKGSRWADKSSFTCCPKTAAEQGRSNSVLSGLSGDSDFAKSGGRVRTVVVFVEPGIIVHVAPSPRSRSQSQHRVEDSLPLLQLETYAPVGWAGRPALTQGRLFAYSYHYSADLRVWYEALARWIRKRFVKNPVPWMSGYVGHRAYAWHEAGGFLLPLVPPPVNAEWTGGIFDQHSSS
jgi:hypothetical protein